MIIQELKTGRYDARPAAFSYLLSLSAAFERANNIAAQATADIVIAIPMLKRQTVQIP